MGAQDSFSQAQEFQGSTGTESFLMIWDQAFSSWSYYGVGSQPTVFLLEPNGEPIKGWRGGIPVDEVLELAAAV